MSANLQNVKFMKIRGPVLELSCIQTDGPTERRSYALGKDANAPKKNNCIEQSSASEAKNHSAILETSTFFNRKMQHSVYETPPLKNLLRDVPPCFTIGNSTSPAYLLTPWSRVLLEKLTRFAANEEIPIYVLVSPMVSFPQASPPKPCAHLFLPPYVPHDPPISFF